jgi:hypothetical protein
MAYSRIAARLGQVVDLNVDFVHNGQLADPYAIYKVEIYKTQILPHNLVAVVPVLDPLDANYPAPVERVVAQADAGACGTEAAETELTGRYKLPYLVPNDFTAPDVYFDLWYFYPEDPCPLAGVGTTGTECDLDDEALTPFLQKCCHRFWLYPDNWYCNDKLSSVRFGFEPLDQRFNLPEVRPLEIGIMPLPLYDFDYNLVMPMIPFLQPSITIETQHHEVLVNDAPCRIGIRQGQYRSNPYVIQYDVDTSTFLKGTYQYHVKLALPDGSTRVSRKFILVIM